MPFPDNGTTSIAPSSGGGGSSTLRHHQQRLALLRLRSRGPHFTSASRIFTFSSPRASNIQFVKGASRRRAAPGSQSMGLPQSRRLRLGSNRIRGLWSASSALFGTRTPVEEGFSLEAKASCHAMLRATKSLLQVSAICSQTVRPNPSLKRSTNGMPPRLGRGCAHIFHSPGLAASRCCPLSSNVRHRNPTSLPARTHLTPRQ